MSSLNSDSGETASPAESLHSCFIVVEGPIGVGKTTLAQMLEARLHCQPLLEPFHENPFLVDFYQDRERYALPVQISFLLSRYRQLQSVHHLLQQGPVVADYCFAKDRLFASLTLSDRELALYEELHAALSIQIPDPALVVFLDASTDVLMSRIAHRDRPYERGMDRSYIALVGQAYRKYFDRPQTAPHLCIDTDGLNIVSTPNDFEFVLNLIVLALHEEGVDIHCPST